jgi:hypothetical protein
MTSVLLLLLPPPPLAATSRLHPSPQQKNKTFSKLIWRGFRSKN